MTKHQPFYANPFYPGTIGLGLLIIAFIFQWITGDNRNTTSVIFAVGFVICLAWVAFIFMVQAFKQGKK